MTEQRLREAASVTPDPDRAFKNLRSFCDANPGHAARLLEHLRPAALLFSISQFLANFAASRPDALFDAVDEMSVPLNEDALRTALRKEIEEAQDRSVESLMDVVRVFKKKALLLITLRDILGKADIVESMAELSMLADVVVGEALVVVRSRMKEQYGEPEDWSFTVVAIGKLGSHELNFSSDIDLLYVYGKEEGETAGTVSARGSVKNRLGSHEYYSKLGEGLNRFLSVNTGEGFCYRVDLRLRPEGQKGSLAVSLAGYEIYYESWGRAWERAVLLRARPVAGDMALGREFLRMVRPFVFRKYLDFSAIDEIRKMKTKINETFKKDDIKRGYGGIREIEFFVHAFELIYGGKEPLLRERSTLRGLHLLLLKNLIGREDYAVLSDMYPFLRKLEQRLQQLNDLQTHTLPAAENELGAMARKMGYSDKVSFLDDLGQRRRKVREIYDSLFMGRGAKVQEEEKKTSLLLSEDLSDAEVADLLSGYSIKDPARIMRNIRHIRESTFSFQTLRGQRLLGEILPVFLDEALRAKNPDAAVNNLQSFIELLSSEESYLDLFAKNGALIPILIRVFSRSDYLAKNIMKRKEYLELLGHEMFTRKTLASMKNELGEIIGAGQPIAESIRIFKQMEEIRLGTQFLDRRISAVRLFKELSKTAEAIVSVCLRELGGEDNLAVIGFGKSGGRELNFNSDLDLIFVSPREVSDADVKAAERLLRLLISYTQDGTAYRVDTRLRPEGSKGPLVSSVEAFRDYYLKAAQFWEFQALLKARPLAGSTAAACRFIEMKREVLREKGGEVSIQDIRAMRARIERELSKEAMGHDIKLGPGGLEELEFTVQYLQLINIRNHGALMVQGTLEGITRLSAAGVIGKETASPMKETYIFYRTLEGFLRLIQEPVLREQSISAVVAAELMGFPDSSGLLKELREKREGVRHWFENLR